MSRNPGPLFRRTFTREVRDAIIDAQQRAYVTATEFHDEKRGSNPATFGFSLYHFSVFQLSELAIQGRIPAHPDRKSNVFRLVLGEYRIASHCVAKSERSDINKSFPNAGGGVAMMGESLPLFQLDDFTGVGESTDVTEQRDVVIAHMGNEADGLCAIYLCIPKRVEIKTDNRTGRRAGEIVEWAYVERIWTRADDELIIPEVNATPAAPPSPPPTAMRPDRLVSPPPVVVRPVEPAAPASSTAPEEEKVGKLKLRRKLPPNTTNAD